MQDYKNFVKKQVQFKPYMVKFEKNNMIKPKKNLCNYGKKKDEWRLIIIITYDKSTFFANNSI